MLEMFTLLYQRVSMCKVNARLAFVVPKVQLSR